MIGINILSHLLAEETVHLKDDLSTFEFKQHSISHFFELYGHTQLAGYRPHNLSVAYIYWVKNKSA